MVIVDDCQISTKLSSFSYIEIKYARVHLCSFAKMLNKHKQK